MAQFLLTDKTRVKALLELGTNTDHDDLLDTMIAAVSSECEKYIKVALKRQGYTREYVLPQHKRKLLLGVYPLQTVTSVKYSNDTTDWSAITAMGATEYRVNMQTGSIRFLRQMTYPHGFVQVVMTGGLAGDLTSAVSLYPDLVRSVDMQVAYEWRRRDTPAGDVTTAGGSTTFTAQVNVLDKVRKIWDYYVQRSY